MQTLFDPRVGYPVKMTEPVEIKDGFIDWNGERREVIDVHQTSKGTQIELVADRPAPAPLRCMKF